MTEADTRRTGVAANLVIDLDGVRHQLDWPPDKTLVEVMLDAGIDVPHSCREGRCGACVATVAQGDVVMADNDVLEPADIADGLTLACQARPVSDGVHIQY